MNALWFLDWLFMFFFGLAMGYLLFHREAKINKSDVGELVIKITADTAQFKKDMDTATKKAKALAAIMNRFTPTV